MQYKSTKEAAEKINEENRKEEQLKADLERKEAENQSKNQKSGNGQENLRVNDRCINFLEKHMSNNHSQCLNPRNRFRAREVKKQSSKRSCKIKKRSRWTLKPKKTQKFQRKSKVLIFGSQRISRFHSMQFSMR